jgi:hypothetical protein
MTRLLMPALLALLSVSMAVPSCAHVQPVVDVVVTCSGKTIPPGVVQQVFADVMAEDWADLLATVVPNLPNGWADVGCIYDALKAKNPAMVPHMDKLRAAHVELRPGGG